MKNEDYREDGGSQVATKGRGGSDSRPMSDANKIKLRSLL